MAKCQEYLRVRCNRAQTAGNLERHMDEHAGKHLVRRAVKEMAHVPKMRHEDDWMVLRVAWHEGNGRCSTP